MGRKKLEELSTFKDSKIKAVYAFMTMAEYPRIGKICREIDAKFGNLVEGRDSITRSIIIAVTRTHEELIKWKKPVKIIRPPDAANEKAPMVRAVYVYFTVDNYPEVIKMCSDLSELYAANGRPDLDNETDLFLECLEYVYENYLSERAIA